MDEMVDGWVAVVAAGVLLSLCGWVVTISPDLEAEVMLGVLVPHQTVLGAEHFAAVRIGAHVRVDGRVQFLVLGQVVLAHKTFATVGPLADESTTRVDVAVGFQVGLLPKSFATVGILAHERLFRLTTALTVVRLVARFLWLLEILSLGLVAGAESGQGGCVFQCQIDSWRAETERTGLDRCWPTNGNGETESG